VETAGTPEVKAETYEQVMDWTMLDDSWDTRTQRTFNTGPVIVPVGGGATIRSSVPLDRRSAWLARMATSLFPPVHRAAAGLSQCRNCQVLILRHPWSAAWKPFLPTLWAA
jgi:hypothetical protein